VARLRGARGFSEADARARLAAQMSNDEREALADRVFWNEGTLEELFVSLARVMDEIGLASG